MATPSLQQQRAESEFLAPSLNLDLSLGGLFSLPKNLSSCSAASFSDNFLASGINLDGPSLLPSAHSSNFWNTSPLPSSSSTLLENPLQILDRTTDMQPHRHHGPVKKRIKGLQSEEIRRQKRARKDQGHSTKDHKSSPLCNSSGYLHIALRKTACNHKHPRLQSADRNMGEYHEHLMPSSRPQRRLSDMQKAPRVTKVPCGSKSYCKSTIPSSGFGPTQIISCPLSSCLSFTTTPSVPSISDKSTRPKTSAIGDEEEKVCHSSSTELENGDNLDEASTAWMKVTEFEAPRSRCGSNSDLIASVGPLAATSAMMYTQPFAMVPVQPPFSMPIQWSYTFPYAIHYSSGHVMPPSTSLPWIPGSANGLQPESLATSCKEGKLQDNQETYSKKDAVTCQLPLSTPPLSNNVQVQDLSQKEELPPAMMYKTLPRSVSDVCMSASSSQPVCSTSLTANDSSDVSTSVWQPSISLTSPIAHDSSDAHKQVDLVNKPVFANKVCRFLSPKACSNRSTIGDGVISCQLFPHKQDDRSKASNSISPSQEGCLKSPCPQKSNDAGPVGNCNLNGRISPGRKPTKTVRFRSDIEGELVKSISNEDQRHDSSSLSARICKSPEMANLCKSQLAKKLQTTGGGTVCKHVHRIGAVAKIRATQEHEQEDGSANSRITSEFLDEGESAPLKVERVGKLEGKNAANLPRVSTTCEGPNGKTIYGVMYITKSKQACLICSCHGMHMSPSEFVQHSGSTDLRNPERSIVVTGFSCV